VISSTCARRFFFLRHFFSVNCANWSISTTRTHSSCWRGQLYSQMYFNCVRTHCPNSTLHTFVNLCL